MTPKKEPRMRPRLLNASIVAAAIALAACSPSQHDSTSSSSGSGGSSGGGGADAGPPLRVLFIGNSYTYVNDLPGRVHALAAASGAATIEVDSVTQGGATLQDLMLTDAPNRISQGGWTHVVLQGQSLEPIFWPASFEDGAKQLSDAAKGAGAAVVFYETWARRAGDAVYDDPSSGGSPAAMQAGLRAEYQKVADAAGGTVAPAGDAWEKSLAELPSIDLFAPDGSHPSVAGTYLVGCVFYAKLTGQSPVGIPDPPPELSASDAAVLQDVAAGVLP